MPDSGNLGYNNYYDLSQNHKLTCKHSKSKNRFSELGIYIYLALAMNIILAAGWLYFCSASTSVSFVCSYRKRERERDVVSLYFLNYSDSFVIVGNFALQLLLDLQFCSISSISELHVKIFALLIIDVTIKRIKILS